MWRMLPFSNGSQSAELNLGRRWFPATHITRTPCSLKRNLSRRNTALNPVPLVFPPRSISETSCSSTPWLEHPSSLKIACRCKRNKRDWVQVLPSNQPNLGKLSVLSTQKLSAVADDNFQRTKNFLCPCGGRENRRNGGQPEEWYNRRVGTRCGRFAIPPIPHLFLFSGWHPPREVNDAPTSGCVQFLGGEFV